MAPLFFSEVLEETGTDKSERTPSEENAEEITALAEETGTEITALIEETRTDEPRRTPSEESEEEIINLANLFLESSDDGQIPEGEGKIVAGSYTKKLCFFF